MLYQGSVWLAIILLIRRAFGVLCGAASSVRTPCRRVMFPGWLVDADLREPRILGPRVASCQALAKCADGGGAC